MRKRCLAAALILALLATVFTFPAAFAAEKDDGTILADFSKGDKLVNLAISCKASTTDYYGRKARRLSNVQADGNLYLRVNVSDSVMYDIPDNTPIDITVEYYDDEKGSFSIQYDSHHPDEGLYNGNKYLMQSTPVELTGTKTWKTATIHLEDMKMANRIDGNDFRVALYSYRPSGYSAGPVIISSVQVVPSDYENLTKLSITSDKLGNIYTDGEEIVLTETVLNKTSDEIATEYKLEVSDKLTGEQIYNSDGQNELEGDAAVENELRIPAPGKRSIYSVTIEETAWRVGRENEKKTQTCATEFSVSDILGLGEGDAAFGYQTQTNSLGRGVPEEVPILQRNMGASWSRDGLAWSTVETEKDVLSLPEGSYDIFKTAKDNGINTLLICSNYNQFYDNGETPNTPEGIAGFARYCGFLASSLKGVVDHFEIWNEYNHTPFNNVANKTGPATYAEMLKQSYIAIKAANPDAVVVGLGQANVDLMWSRQVFEAGGLEYCDAISCHPYDWSYEFNEDTTLKSIQNLRSIMNEFGYDKPIWLTEVGFSSIDDVVASKPAYHPYTQTEQAASTVLLNAVLKAYDAMDMMIGYCLYDRNNQKDLESCWGLNYAWYEAEGYKPRNGAKESYLAVAAMNRFLGSYNAEYSDMLVDGRSYAFKFTNNSMNKDVLFIQNGMDSGESLRSFKLGCPSVDVYDMFGNKTETICSDNGIFTFVAGEVPIYAVGNFTDFAESDGVSCVEPETITAYCAENDTAALTFTSNTDKELIVEAVAEDGLSVQENTGFIDGKAVIVLKSADDIEGTKTVRVRVTDKSGNVYYSADHNVTVREPVVTEIDFIETVEGTSSHMAARIVVTNTSNSAYQSGTVSITAPADIAKSAAKREFKNLAPGKKATFLFHLPTQIVKRVIKLSALVDLESGFSVEVNKNMELTSAAYAEQKPQIDGEVSDGEWQGIWFGSDGIDNVHDLTTPWRGPDDLSFSGIMMWDEEYLYYLAVVTDDIYCISYSPQTPYYMYKGDGIQFGLDDRKDVAAGDETLFNEFGIAELPGDKPAVFRYNTVYGLPDDAIVEGAEAASQRRGTETLYEAKIPWKGIFNDEFVPEAGRSYKFSTIINDNDGADRRGWISYGEGMGSGISTEKFGSLTLVK